MIRIEKKEYRYNYVLLKSELNDRILFPLPKFSCQNNDNETVSVKY
jgi:hypothetical protein